ncbi:MAG: hypothetical protein K7J46_05495 [Bryobacter sp.]|jgi:hypothetical protein|nr:hypothetical protein [Bryobacter sp. CoA8 C33]
MTFKQLVQASILSPEAVQLQPLATGAQHFAQLLIERNLWQDAIAYMAHAIRAREAIWWGWFCARKAAVVGNNPKDAEALKVCEAWIAQPSPQTLEQAQAFLPRAAGRPGVEALLRAVAATGEIVNEESGSRVAPPPLLANRFVQVTVLQAAYEIDAAAPEVAAADFLKQSREVAARIQLWNQFTV